MIPQLTAVQTDPVEALLEPNEPGLDEDLSAWALGADDAAADQMINTARELVALGHDPLDLVERRLELAAHRPLAARAIAAILAEVIDARPSERARSLVDRVSTCWPGDVSVAYLVSLARRRR